MEKLTPLKEDLYSSHLQRGGPHGEAPESGRLEMKVRVGHRPQPLRVSPGKAKRGRGNRLM